MAWKTTVCTAKYFSELEAHEDYCLLFRTQKYSAYMTVSAFSNMAPTREKSLSIPTLLSTLGLPGPRILHGACPSSHESGSPLAVPTWRERKSSWRGWPSLLMWGPWHCFCCQSGCLLVASGSLHFLCGFCGRFHPPVWSLSEALVCQTSLFELVPGHLRGRWSQIPYI